jgi:hypothetical protein
MYILNKTKAPREIVNLIRRVHIDAVRNSKQI